MAASANELDVAILHEYPYTADLYSPNAPPKFQANLEAALLKEIVQSSNGQFDKAFSSHDNCLELLQRDLPLRTLLLDCWKAGSFQSLRTAEQLLSKSSNAIDRRSGSANVSNAKEYTNGNVNIYGGSFTEIASGGNQYNYYSGSSSEFNAEYLDLIPSIDYKAKHSEVLASRTQSTGVWFLESHEFKRWYENPDEKLLFCFGQPGAGKTVLASTIIEYLGTGCPNHDVVNFAYLDHNKRHEQSATVLLGSFLRRIVDVTQGRLDLEAVSSFCKRLRGESRKPTLKELQDILRSIYANFRQIYLVVDALDEFQENMNRHTLDELLRVLTSLGDHVKIVITSRVFGSIDQALLPYTSSRIGITAHSSDIKQYITNRIGIEAPFAIGHVEIIIEKVMQAAQASFLLARLHINSLSQNLSLGDLLDALDDMSNGIEEAYDAILTRISQQTPKKRELARNILCWVAYGDRLSLLELQHALATVAGRHSFDNYCYSAETISEVCVGLLDMHNLHQCEDSSFTIGNINMPSQAGPSFIRKPTTFNGVIPQAPLRSYIPDHTTYEYFHRNKNTLFNGADLYIARTCLAYLSNPVFEAPHFNSSAGDCYRVARSVVSCWELSRRQPTMHENGVLSVDLSRLLESLPFDDTLEDTGVPDLFRTYPFLMYAVRALSTHVQVIEDTLVEELIGLFNSSPKIMFLSCFAEHTVGGSMAHVAAHNGLTKVLHWCLSATLGCPEALEPYSVLCTAAAAGQEGSIQLLLHYREITSDQPQVPLGAIEEAFILACESHHNGAAKLLLRGSGFDFGYATGNGCSIIETIIERTTGVEVLECFLEISRERHPTEYHTSEWTPLIFATIGGDIYKVKVLLNDNRTNYTAPNPINGGKDALTYAAQHLIVPIAQLLFQAIPSLNVNAQCLRGRTPLSWIAVGEQYPNATSFEMTRETIELFLSHPQININLPDYEGRTPLSYFSEYETTPNGVHLLLACPNIQVDLADDRGRTPLWYAVEKGKTEVVRALLPRTGPLNEELAEKIRKMPSKGSYSTRHPTMDILMTNNISIGGHVVRMTGA